MEDMLFFLFLFILLILFLLFQSISIAGSFQTIALFSWCDIDILHDCVFNDILIECHFLISRLDVFEGEIYQTVLVAGAHIKEVVTIHLDVLDGDVVALALFVYYYILVLFICNLR